MDLIGLLGNDTANLIFVIVGILLAISELLPFLKVQPNGVIEAIVKFLRKIKEQKPQ